MNPADDRALEDGLAAEPMDSDDFAVLNALRAYYDEHDPVPDGLVERIQFELTLDALQAEVATLTQLDLADAGARGSAPEAVRTITFTSESATTMVTISPSSEDLVRVDGWVAPGAGVRVELLLADGSRDIVADEDGRFVFEQVPTGLAKFALYLPAGVPSATVVSPTIEL